MKHASISAEDTALAVDIFQETLAGMEFMQGLGPAVTVYGSARFGPKHAYYKLARATGAAFANAGFAVITGGGPGVMEAANRGADEAGGVSVGCNITLPFEQKPNKWVDRFMEFKHFHVRKQMLRKVSSAIILMPGGYGTLDEIFENLTLMQTGKQHEVPVVVMGTDFWPSLGEFIRNTLLDRGAISRDDISFFTATDDPDEAVRIVKRALRSKKNGRGVRDVMKAERKKKGLQV
jgi:uncharacterized protein (TIGR00730 family)